MLYLFLPTHFFLYNTHNDILPTKKMLAIYKKYLVQIKCFLKRKLKNDKHDYPHKAQFYGSTVYIKWSFVKIKAIYIHSYFSIMFLFIVIFNVKIYIKR